MSFVSGVPQWIRRRFPGGAALLLAALLVSPQVGAALTPPVPPQPDTVGPEVAFMQGMILHHAQALEMARLAPERTDHEGVLALMRRIEVAQQDEIQLMKRWLERRGHRVPSDEEIAAHARGLPEGTGDAHAPDEAHGDHGDSPEGMAGMLSRERFRKLEEAESRQFDRLLLEAMIFHHEGAILMVEELLETPQAVAGSEVFSLVTHVESVQQSEITRMQAMLRDMEDGGGSP